MRNESAQPEQKNPSIIGAILAAGGASRFGSPKQLVKFQSKTLLEHAIDALMVPEIKDRCIVLGSNFKIIDAHLKLRENKDSDRLAVLFNAAWKNGLSSSIHTATNYAITRSATHLLLLTSDQPFVNAKLIKSMTLAAAVFESSPEDKPAQSKTGPLPERIVACRYGDSAGIPALFPARVFGELLELDGDRGAKSLLQRHGATLIDFPAGVHDIDSPADLLASRHI